MGAIVICFETQLWQRFLMVWGERGASMVWPEFFLSVASTAKDDNFIKPQPDCKSKMIQLLNLLISTLILV